MPDDAHHRIRTNTDVRETGSRRAVPTLCPLSRGVGDRVREKKPGRRVGNTERLDKQQRQRQRTACLLGVSDCSVALSSADLPPCQILAQAPNHLRKTPYGVLLRALRRLPRLVFPQQARSSPPRGLILKYVVDIYTARTAFDTLDAHRQWQAVVCSCASCSAAVCSMVWPAQPASQPASQPQLRPMEYSIRRNESLHVRNSFSLFVQMCPVHGLPSRLHTTLGQAPPRRLVLYELHLLCFLSYPQ